MGLSKLLVLRLDAFLGRLLFLGMRESFLFGVGYEGGANWCF